MNVTLNEEANLYVIRAGGGYSCFGFDNCFAETAQLSERLGEPSPSQSDWGTIELYKRHSDLVHKASEVDLGTWFNPGTSKEVQNILERVRASRVRVRLFFGDTDTGQVWLDEYDVIGRVSRSMGPLKTPILIARSNSSGGAPIMTDRILRIIQTDTHQELYRHPLYREPVFDVRPASSNPFEQRHDVFADGEIQALTSFDTESKAHLYVRFMRGQRFTKQ